MVLGCFLRLARVITVSLLVRSWAKPALFARCRGFVPAEDQLAVLNGFKAEHGIA